MRARDDKTRADTFGTLAHAHHAEAVVAFFGIEPDAVIRHAQVQLHPLRH